MGRLHVDEDVALESKMFSRQIESSQARVEGYHFDTRRHVVEYDDVMNKQREIIYGERRKILEGVDTRANFLNMLEHVVGEEVPTFCEGRNRETWDLEGLWDRMRQFSGPLLPAIAEVDLGSLGESVPEVIETIVGELTSIYEELEQKHGAELMRRAEQLVMLSVIDEKWRAYLTQMEHMRESIGFQATARWTRSSSTSRRPTSSFQDLMAEIQRDIVRFLFTIKFEALQPPQEPPPSEAATGETARSSPRADQPGAGRSAEARGRPTPGAARRRRRQRFLGPGHGERGGSAPAVASPRRPSPPSPLRSPAPAPGRSPRPPPPRSRGPGRARPARRGWPSRGSPACCPRPGCATCVESSAEGTRRTDGGGTPPGGQRQRLAAQDGSQ